jgi:Spy/CpxP family protein refolding chaperone
MVDGMAQMLGLTADQATALKAILTTTDTTMQPLMEAVAAANKALRDAVLASDFDSATGLATKAMNAQLDVVKASIAGWARIQASDILTADQFTKLLAGPGPGGPPPPGPGDRGSSSSRGRR